MILTHHLTVSHCKSINTISLFKTLTNGPTLSHNPLLELNTIMLTFIVDILVLIHINFDSDINPPISS